MAAADLHIEVTVLLLYSEDKKNVIFKQTEKVKHNTSSILVSLQETKPLLQTNNVSMHKNVFTFLYFFLKQTFKKS